MQPYRKKNKPPSRAELLSKREQRENSFSLCRVQKGVALQNEARIRDSSIDKQCCKPYLFWDKVVLYQLNRTAYKQKRQPNAVHKSGTP